jgi:hypothetical protein
MSGYAPLIAAPPPLPGQSAGMSGTGHVPGVTLNRPARHARAPAHQDGDGLAAVAEEYAEADRALFAVQARIRPRRCSRRTGCPE